LSTETLSQAAVDSLLNQSLGIAASPAAERAAEPEARLYDFRRPHRVSRERLRTLEAMYNQLVRSLEGWLISRVREQVELTLEGVEQFTFSEFTMALPTPCTSYIFETNEQQQGIIDFGPELVVFLVDRLFGGSGKPVPPDRAVTPIERMAVKSVADRAVVLLQEVWRDHIPMEMSITGFESMPEILQGARGDESVLVATIRAQMAGVESLLMICLPFTLLERFFAGARDRKMNRSSGAREDSRHETEATLRSTAVPISARLPAFPLELGELARLGPGSVLSTGLSTRSELEVRVNNQPRFRGAVGRVGSNLAVRILDELVGAADSSPIPFSGNE
jgi:flagellar motor switch protein FliM